MKKTIFICLLFLVLIGCSTNDNQKLTGKEISDKLEKYGIESRYNKYENGYSIFSLPKKENELDPYRIIFYYSDDEVTGFRFDESADEESNTYHYDIDKDYSYVFLWNEDCYHAIDGKAPKDEVGVCSGKDIKKAKSVYNEFDKIVLEKIGVTKDDLITFGNWYYKNNSD